MSNLPSPRKSSLRKLARLGRKRGADSPDKGFPLDGSPLGRLLSEEYELRVICLYPSVVAGKLARQWLETALQSISPHACYCIEYFNFAVLSRDGINWEHVIGRIRPSVILMVGDGNHTLTSGLRHSLRDLLSRMNGSFRPAVIFRDLEPEPTLNTRVLLDYVSALAQQNHSELSAMNGNGTTISCFRNPRHLLSTRRKHHE